jgi:hypothetical protein
MTRPYTNPEGLSLQACTICGFCERFGCEQFAKASPQTVILPRVFEQPNSSCGRTRMSPACSSTIPDRARPASFTSTRKAARRSSRPVGRNYTYQMDPAVTVFYSEDININPFMGAGALATAIEQRLAEYGTGVEWRPSSRVWKRVRIACERRCAPTASTARSAMPSACRFAARPTRRRGGWPTR